VFGYPARVSKAPGIVSGAREVNLRTVHEATRPPVDARPKEQVMDDDAMAKAIGWQTCPLCCRYLLVLFETLSIQVEEGGVVRDRTLRWAFGVLADGQHEVLGAWLGPEAGEATWQEVFDDIKVRGVENIGFVASSEPATVHPVLRAAYPSATSLRSIGQLLARGLPKLRPRDHEPAANVLRAAGVAAGARAAQEALAGVAVSRFGPTYPAAVQRWRAAVQQLGPFYAMPPRRRRTMLASEVALQHLQRRAGRAIGRHGRFADGAAATAFVMDALRHAERRIGLVGARVDVASDHRADRASRRNTRFSSGALGL
jgi:transposase-like protein